MLMFSRLMTVVGLLALLASIECHNCGTSWRFSHGFAALKQDGSVATWGQFYLGGSGVPSGLSNVQAIYSTDAAFAALKHDGTVAAWGYSACGGSGVPSGLSNVQAIYSTGCAFAALKNDGTVAAWGDSRHGGSGVPSGLSNVQAIYSTYGAFAALKQDGSVAAWGGSDHGGIGVPSGLSNVRAISSIRNRFVALKVDGTVATWGVPLTHSEPPPELSNVRAIYSTGGAFAALKEDGSVAAWGLFMGNNDGIGVPGGLSNVQAIYSTYYAFAALKQDGSVAAWGHSSYGGSGVPEGLSNVQAIYSTSGAFAALKQDGSVAAWGYYMGNYGSDVPSGLSNVHAIYSTYSAFAALKNDSSVAAWGDSNRGGIGMPSGLSNVQAIYSTGAAFAALKHDGTVAAWGDSNRGGIVPEGLSNVSNIFGSTIHYSDSTSTSYYPCPPRYYGQGVPHCKACPGDVPSHMMNNFSLGIRSVVGSCILCEQGSYSLDGRTCVNSCAEGYTYHPPRFDDGTLSGCRVCPYTGYYYDSTVESCLRCPKGEYSDGNGFKCSLCPIGEYAPSNGFEKCYRCIVDILPPGEEPPHYVTLREGSKSPNDCFPQCNPGSYGVFGDRRGKCYQCPIGTFSSIVNAVSIESCSQCPVKYYNSFPGATQCSVCSPGQECSTTGLAKGYDCAKGTFALNRGSEKCLRCPPGRYESNPGEAQCSACPGGKFNERLGSSALGDCEDCPAGTFAFTNGSSQCLQCGKTEYQPEKGQTMCFQCAGVGKIGNVERTSCIVDPAFAKLNGPSLLDSLYSKGLALYITFSIAALFAGAIFLVHFKKAGFNNAEQSSSQSGSNEIDSSLLGMLTPLQIGMKSGIAGLSFGSELLLIITYLGQAPWSAAGLIFFRLLHAIVAGMFLSILFGYDAIAVWLEEKGIVYGASKLRQLLNDKFSLENLPFVMVPVLLSMIDCPFFQFLPWRDSTLYRESKGFPSLSLLKWSLGTDVLHATASAIIQIYQLATRQTSSSQEIALTGMNISFSLIGIASSLVVFCLKTALLEHKEDVKDTTPEMEAVYQLEESKNLGFIMKNPMYDSSNDVEVETFQAPEYMSTLYEKYSIEDTRLLRSQIGTLEQDNSALKEENNAIKVRLETLERMVT